MLFREIIGIYCEKSYEKYMNTFFDEMQSLFMLVQVVRIVTIGFKRLVWIGWILLVRFVCGMLNCLLESDVRH